MDLSDHNDQTFVSCSGSVRYHIIKSMFQDLLGPKMGPGEIIENPYDQYVLGILKSNYIAVQSDQELDPFDKINYGNVKSEKQLDSTDDPDDEFIVDADLNLKQGARSMGLSFVIKGKVPRIKICCTWGRYQRIDGLPRSIWKRIPNFFISQIIDATNNQIIKPEETTLQKYISKQGIEIHIRSSQISIPENSWNVSIFIVNNTPFKENQELVHYIFQPQIRVLCDAETEIKDLKKHHTSSDVQKDDLLFSDKTGKGRGHLCGAVWRDIDPECYDENGKSFSDFSWPDATSSKIPKDVIEEFKKSDIRTEYLPVYTILQPDLGNSNNFNASRLAQMWEPNEIKNYLGGIVRSYREWINDEKKSINNSESTKLQEYAKMNLDVCEKTAQRIEDGITLLLDDERARLAFCFMNQVMSDKRRWDNRNEKERQSLQWYEFQMGFILQSLTGVLPGNQDKGTCDVLWFPTGGGKTEAYIGIMIFTFAYRRLFDLEEFQTDGGVSVISRYTLRLLTIQQFTRTISAILAADVLRIKNWKPESAVFNDQNLIKTYETGRMWGSSRFSLGVWIGDLTPNKFEKQGTRHTDILNAEGMLRAESVRRRESQSTGEPAQIMECPCCGNILGMSSKKESGMENMKKITWIIKTDKTIEDLKAIPDAKFNTSIIKLMTKNGSAKEFFEINLDAEGMRYVCFTANICSTSGGSLTDNNIDEWWKHHTTSALGYTGGEDPLQSTRASRPGYFFLYRDGENRPYDFAIHCTNRDCEINKTEWFEDITPDSVSSIAHPFKKHKKPNHSIFPPIPAYIIDEQIYSRCPTVVIATVDKFARLPFEPRASALFGNVDYHDKWKGFGRGNPNDGSGRDVKKFLPPSLFIQDELHLIEGPLGSMVGIYEIAVDILSSNEQFTPKYIASTATIKEAESQVGTIYRRKVRIFPPLAVSYGNNYFSTIEEDPSCLRESYGRLYIGILAPKGTLVVPVKVWASVLSSVHRIKNNPELFGLDEEYKKSASSVTFKEFVDDKTDWYSTLVGYFNALKELSIARNLYSGDILRDVKRSSSLVLSSVQHRGIDNKIKTSLHYVPIEINTRMCIFAVSVFCANRKGSISLALYENNELTNEPGKLLSVMRKNDEKKQVKEDENEFLLDVPIDVSKGKIIWVALFPYSDDTRFHLGESKIKSRTASIKLGAETIQFPKEHQKSEESSITIKIGLKTEPRSVDDAGVVELSSSTESHELPNIMKKLETPHSVDCLFTTSMFGTGMDVDRLGLMVVMGQPKSTSSYIQSTGRVGRKCPGLVVTWLRAGRVRDLSHYEDFIGYHRAIHRYVEPISAAPFSEQTMDLCTGPVSVAVLRNARSISGSKVQEQWRDHDNGPPFMRLHENDDEIHTLKKIFLKRCLSENISEARRIDPSQAENIIERSIGKWQRTSKNISQEGDELVYDESTMNKKVEKNVVLGTVQHNIAGKSIVYKNTRSSLRTVESTFTIGDVGWVEDS